MERKCPRCNNKVINLEPPVKKEISFKEDLKKVFYVYHFFCERCKMGIWQAVEEINDNGKNKQS